MNWKLRVSLQDWDPFGYGSDAYETEIVDVIQVVHEIGDDVQALAKSIQTIYEFSYEEVIPLDSCMNIANTLISIQQQASCEL
ncbi:DUF1871 family protein [Bacillus sp. FJAT-49736]|nr:DUF1871 family protein [Bacillus sp. FJAT-49736]